MRRRTLAAASAAALCLGALLTGCGSDDEGYVAVGAAGPDGSQAPTKAVTPRDKVEMVPLDGGESTGPGSDGKGAPGGSDGRGGKGADGGAPGAGGNASPGISGPPESSSRRSGGSGPGADSPSSTGSSRPNGERGDEDGPGSGRTGTGGGPSSPPVPPGPPGSTAPSDPAGPPGSTPPQPPPTPARLTSEGPRLADTDARWCEKVTMDFRNSGDKPIISGKVTFKTHVIGALGVDWATITSSRNLPVPIEGGRKVTRTWKLCVDAWRVPWGMHIETQGVDVDWR